MKCLERNKSTFFYALFDRQEEIEDEYGNPTGEHNVIHGKPIEAKANISPSKGETEVVQFGTDVKYDRVIVVDNVNTPIDEHTILWVDTLPTFDELGEVITPHDYVVKKVAKSINSVSIAISKVNVNG